MKKFLSLLLVSVMLLVGVTGCGKTEQTKGNIVVYTSEPQDLVTEMLDDFVSKNPGITYELFRSGTGSVTAKIDAEMQAGGTKADVIWLADIGYIYNLDKQGKIEHYTPKAASSINSRFNYNDGMAFEVRQIFNIIAYNTTVNTVKLTDWDDLLDPGISGKFAMANPNYSGGAFTTLMTHVMNPNIGWPLYEGFKNNNIKFEQSNGNLQTKVASGEYAAVSVVDFMALNAKREGSPVEVVWPESGAVMVPTPIAIMSTVKEENKAACQALIDYMLTEDAQKFFVSQGYIPVSETVGVPEGAPQVKDIVVMDFDLNYYLDNSTAVRDKFASIFGE